jgi:hypothetical protein
MEVERRRHGAASCILVNFSVGIRQKESGKGRAKREQGESISGSWRGDGDLRTLETSGMIDSKFGSIDWGQS